MKYLIKPPSGAIKGEIKLSASKSESNRVLIIKALCNDNFVINNLSDSDDTKILADILEQVKVISENNIGQVNVGAAGTTMRFLTAYLASKKGTSIIISGSERMHQRPIGILVDSLRTLGANIEYMEKEGFPPLKIQGNDLKGGLLKIDGSISSQYITALLLIAPQLESDLIIELTGKINSRPYIEMTLKIMSYFGIEYSFEHNIISIKKQTYTPKDYTVEGDWSSASYWFSLVALAQEAEITIKGLNQNSLQGDSVIQDLAKQLGVETSFKSNTVSLYKQNDKVDFFEYDFSNCPDIAQTIAVICSGLNIEAKLTGLESLKIKETNRVQALINEIEKTGSVIKESETNVLTLEGTNKLNQASLTIETYEDHRMALAFAPLSLLAKNIVITNPLVITKSYPNFWEELEKLGFTLVTV